MEQPDISEVAQDLQLREQNTIPSDEETMSVSDDAASEGSFAAEDNDVNEDSEFKDTSYMRLNYEDKVDMAVSDDAFTSEHNDDEDLDLIEKVTVYSSCEAEKNMDLSDETSTEEQSADEDSDDEDLEIRSIHWMYTEDEDDEFMCPYNLLDENDDLMDVEEDPIDEDEDIMDGNIGSGDKKTLDSEFARSACKIHSDDLIHFYERLKFLDLAAPRYVGYEKWWQKVLFEYFRLKCPALTQDKIDTLRALVGLNKIFNFLDLYEMLLGEHVREVEKMESDLFYCYQTRFLESLENSNRKSKRRSILRFIRLWQLQRLFANIYPFRIYRDVYLKVMSHLRKDFKDDSKLIIYVLHNLCTISSLRYFVFLYEETEELEFLISHALKQKYNFWSLYDQKCPNFPFNVLSICMLNQDCRNTKTLLKYGFPYVFARSAFKSLCKALCDVEFWMVLYENDDQGFIMADDTGNTSLLELSPANFRSQMVIQVYYYFIQFPYFSDCKKVCIKWSRSIPDPYVTPCEMFVRLKDYVASWFERELGVICDKYADTTVYDDDHNAMAPRKLSHLCRCSVREQLKKNYELPHGIDKLGMPNRIRDYLLLEW